MTRVRNACAYAGAWENWLLYMLRAVASTSRTTLELIEGVRAQMADYKNRIRRDLPKLYSRTC